MLYFSAFDVEIPSPRQVLEKKYFYTNRATLFCDVHQFYASIHTSGHRTAIQDRRSPITIWSSEPKLSGEYFFPSVNSFLFICMAEFFLVSAVFCKSSFGCCFRRHFVQEASWWFNEYLPCHVMSCHVRTKASGVARIWIVFPLVFLTPTIQSQLLYFTQESLLQFGFDFSSFWFLFYPNTCLDAGWNQFKWNNLVRGGAGQEEFRQESCFFSPIMHTPAHTNYFAIHRHRYGGLGFAFCCHLTKRLIRRIITHLPALTPKLRQLR